MQAMSDLRGVRVGVLGGGITGLTSAYYLLRAGAGVTILEARKDVGGLSNSFDFGPFQWDRFYHCVLTSDAALRALIADLGLSSELRWTHTKVGFFAEGQLHSMSSGIDFLRFPPLNLWQKMRLGAGILYASRIKDGYRLESELATDWLRRIFGQANYDKMWAPLLKCKLGACREEASAAFIWATIARLFSTRENKDGAECLGYVRGGYRTVFTRLVQEVRRLGGEIRTGVPLNEIHSNGTVAVRSGQERFEFDRVVSTLPSPILARIAPQLSSGYLSKLDSVKYLGVVCFALVLKRPLSPYYVTNLIDDVPFTGIIEMTNLISREETAGYHLVYLPKYTAPCDPLFELSEDEIWKAFCEGLKRVIGDFSDADIEARHLFRERFVQPIPVLRYSEIVPPMESDIDGLVVANTTQIINSTLNNNEMVKIARRAVAAVQMQCLRVKETAESSVPLIQQHGAPVNEYQI
jgi:protoporphyrinogen oxidase